MVRPASRVAAFAVILGLLVGSSPANPEPEVVVALQDSMTTPAAPQIAWSYPVPYADSPQPTRVRIPAIDVAGDIRPVGMSDAVTMQVPSDIRKVGWFDRSVLPISDSGHTVLVGHRDGASDPNGIFRNLGEVKAGDVIHVQDIAGRLLEYAVTEVSVLSDASFAEQALEIFRTRGAHRLVLITCGGTYDESRGGYQANVVVTAKRT